VKNVCDTQTGRHIGHLYYKLCWLQASTGAKKFCTAAVHQIHITHVCKNWLIDHLCP